MHIRLIEYPEIAWAISAVSIALCFTVCAMMAYRISHVYSRSS
jgi:hypothetical protein